MILYLGFCLIAPLLWGLTAAHLIKALDRKAKARALPPQPDPEMYEI